jgi:hypothetical protein
MIAVRIVAAEEPFIPEAHMLDTLVHLWVSSIYGKPWGTGSSYGCRMGRISSSTFGSSMVDGVGSSLP